MKKITITGTKGKTTISSILASVLESVEPKVLSVNTNGAYINGEQVVSKAESSLMWDLVPTVSPGRFLYLLHEPGEKKEGINHLTADGVAVLEASLGSGTQSGLGYYGHDVGVFTNVYEDHLGSRPDLNTREDIGRSKSFVFSRINREGYAVFNADDDVVCNNLHLVKETVTLIPFGIDFTYFDVKAHLANGGMALTVKDSQVILLKQNEERVIMTLADVVWTFNGNFVPSVYNLLAVIGALIGYGSGEISDVLIQAVKDSRLDPASGRLVLLKNENNIQIIADYAHEKQSLKSVAELAQSMLRSPENKVIGVVRLTWDRTQDLIEDTARYIAPYYDEFVVYDKIDGYWRMPSERSRTGQPQFAQEVGKVSAFFANELVKSKGADHVKRILREDEALAYAATLAHPGDIVVFIVNDDIRRSFEFVKQSFNAEIQ